MVEWIQFGMGTGVGIIGYVGGKLIVNGILNGRRKPNGHTKTKCSGEHCTDHQEVFQHIIESRNDIKWIKEKLDN